jgi:hypothetical protein
VYFDTALNPINPASFDPDKPNCLIHPLPAVGTLVKDSNGNMLPIIDNCAFLSDFPGNFDGNGNGKTETSNGKFDTIEYIPGHATLDNAGAGVDLNGDGKINTYYRTPERQLMFSSDCFSRELTTTSVSYRIVVTTELCDAASVLRNPTAPIVVAHSEMNVGLQLAADIEGSVAKEAASEFADGNANPSQRDPGLHYYRNNLPTTRKAHTYDATTGEILTYNCDTNDLAKVGTLEAYDPVKEAKGLQIRGGTLYENCTTIISNYATEDRNLSFGAPGSYSVGTTSISEDRNGNGVLDKESVAASARQWVDPLGVPEGPVANPNLYRNLYYKDTPGAHSQNKRRFVIKDLINLGAGY